ncbi:MAG: class IV adenylate cyclase [Asgard group archaeon]|nr:class IV adenylate cyclase [Asgard group archaeon]
MYEVELKFPIKDIESLEYQLRELGGSLDSVSTQRDSYFNHPQRDFKHTDEALRIREEGTKCYLTYKGQRLDRKSKTRKEFNVEIKDAEKIQAILKALGFELTFVVLKERRRYSYQDFTICFDNIDNLGAFIEIESLVKTESEINQIEEKIFAITKDIGVKEEEPIKKSYLELLLAKQKGE